MMTSVCPRPKNDPEQLDCLQSRTMREHNSPIFYTKLKLFKCKTSGVRKIITNTYFQDMFLAYALTCPGFRVFEAALISFICKFHFRTGAYKIPSTIRQ